MESNSKYEESYKEMIKIRKNILSGKVSIDLEKLDNESAGILKQSIMESLSKRINTVSNIIQNNN